VKGTQRKQFMRAKFFPLPVLFFAVGFIGFAGHAVAGADSTGPLDDTINVSFGTFLLSTDTRVRLNGSGGQQGTEVDLGRDLGFKDANRFRIDATWRFFARHKIRLLYFDTNDHRDKTITRDLTIGDTTYPASANLQSTNRTTIAEVAYEYAFLKRENYEVTGSAGIHTVKFKLGVSGEGAVNGNTGQFSTESATTTAPLPVFGARGLWRFAPQWYFDGQAQYFALKVDNVDGHITDVRAGVTRMFGKHFGVGAGWNQFVTKVSIDKASFEGSLRWRYSGAMLYISGSY
jgi:hypothetical protein